MTELNKTTDLVKHILETRPECRNSDNLLYCKVIDAYERKADFRLSQIPVQMFFENHGYGIPSIETVGRCRRKVQELHPELRACDSVEAARTDKQITFRTYAKVNDHE